MATAAPPERKQGWLDWMGLGAGTFACRTWVFGDGHTATLEHDCLIGRRIFTVDGQELYNETVFPDRGFDLEFKIGSSTGCASVKNVHRELAIYYTLAWEGKEVVSTVFRRNDAKETSLESKFGVSVPSVTDAADVTIYKVEVKNLKSGKTKSLDKRFSDFVELHHKVWSSYAGSHLLSNVPTPPERKWKLFTDHKNAAFLESRRAGLHAFISKLVQIPRISDNTYVLEFLEETTTYKGSEKPVLVSVSKVLVESSSAGDSSVTTTSTNLSAAPASDAVSAPAPQPVDGVKTSDTEATTAKPADREVASKSGPEEDAGESDWI